MEEKDIIKGCKKEDRQAQRQLYELYIPYVHAICLRFGVNDSDLKDVVQEIFIEVFLNIKKYKPKKGAFKYWLKSIAIHKLLNLQRKKKSIIIQLEDAPAKFTPSEQIQLNELDQEYILELIKDLPEGFRTVFNLHVIDGYSHKEIAELLKINEVSSRSQLSRAKRALKEKLSHLKKRNQYGLI